MKDKKLNVSIIGGSGYTGVELVRLLVQHPGVSLQSIYGSSSSGKEMSHFYSGLSHTKLPKIKSLEDLSLSNTDVVFCCLPHGTSQEIISQIYSQYNNIVIIDLSADFRLKSTKDYKEWYDHEHLAPHIQPNAVYGLSEIYKNEISSAKLIACPGCYPTSVLLPTIPLLRESLVDLNHQIVIDSKSGISGAGRSLKESSLFCERSGDIMCYNINNHRHTSEILQEFSFAISKSSNKIKAKAETHNASIKPDVIFNPQLAPINRGMLSNIYLKLNFQSQSKQETAKILESTYSKFYANSPFVEYIIDKNSTSVSIKEVVYTNKCRFSIAITNSNTLIITSVIDNITKGASGQAIQNMNMRFNLPETTSLPTMPIYP